MIAPVEFGVFNKTPVGLGSIDSIKCDVLLSAYTVAERVNRVFESICASDKHWVIHSEYAFGPETLPTSGRTFELAGDEVQAWLSYLAEAGLDQDLSSIDLVVDITGMLRAHLLSLLKILHLKGVRTVRMLYSEPDRYVKAEKTQFSLGVVQEVRQVRGYEGSHDLVPSADELLFIGTGYDEILIRHVAERYSRADKYQMFGLPSLQPQMYQENHLRASGAAESVGASSSRNWLFAPANDPFATASVLQDTVRGHALGVGDLNIYLAPLGTKPQVLGFGLYYLYELDGAAASAVLPISDGYTQESSVGLSRLWMYEFRLPNIDGSAPA